MNYSIDTLERERTVLQAQLDSQKTQAERNRLGQFATPAVLAREILKYAAKLFPSGEKVHFLDPAIGTGAFYSALHAAFRADRVAEALGFEVDPVYAAAASKLWGTPGLEVKMSDFTQARPSARFNLVICNPPYVRHHHMRNDEKSRLQLYTYQASNMKITGLAGLYCHFLGLAHAWMIEGAVAGWLIPSEFKDVNYGLAVKRYLLDRVTLLHIHRFDPNDIQFADALVSSAVVWFRKSSHHEVTR
jgi:adenine-specific DNA-methyltransferase